MNKSLWKRLRALEAATKRDVQARPNLDDFHAWYDGSLSTADYEVLLPASEVERRRAVWRQVEQVIADFRD